MVMILIEGIDKVLTNLNAEIRNIHLRTKAGMREAALIVRRRSQQLTPVKTGNLKGSAYTLARDMAVGPGAEIGYTAAYAPFVHEIPPPFMAGSGQRHATHHPPGQWKFLETALIEKRREILDVIERAARIRS
jgi:hypothetical protein